MAKEKPAWAKAIQKAKTSKSGTPIRDGTYDLTVVNLIVREGHKGTSFIAEFVVDTCVPAREGVTPNPVGSRCSYVTNLTKNEMGPGNAKAFLMALTGSDEGDMEDDEFLDALVNLVGDDQPMRGARIRDVTFFKKTKAGADFTGHNWETIDQTPEDMAARRKQIDTTGV